MLLIDSRNAADYLRSTGRVSSSERIEATELSGGVSNIVILVTLVDRGDRFVLKQARERLRVKDEWLCPPERIWREVDVLRICGELLCGNETIQEVAVGVPALLWQDRPNYLYAMCAAPAEHQTWKQRLLVGTATLDRPIAAACGQMLGTMHAESWRNASIATQLSDQSYFDQLRLDPYYRQVGRVHPELSPRIDELLDSLTEHRLALVHGDFSPKNLLVWPGHALLIDFEVGHYGDPAFDLGFFLTHLALKSVWAGKQAASYRRLATDFWQAYGQRLEKVASQTEQTRLEQRTLLNLAGCMLARIDGKSPVDYLSPERQQLVRDVARSWLLQPPATIPAALEQLP